MIATWKTVRVFISSTFRDMQAERDWLLKRVFPALRQRLEPYCMHLVDVDLRWGITREQADNDQVLGLCLQQIDECRPFFLGLLGGRYGWVPTKFPVEVGKRYGWTQHQTGKSVTELEILHGVIKDPAIHGRALFCFRSERFLDDINDAQQRRIYVEGPTDEELRDLGREEAARGAALRREQLANLKNQIRALSPSVSLLDGYSCAWESAGSSRREEALTSLPRSSPEKNEPPYVGCYTGSENQAIIDPATKQPGRIGNLAEFGNWVIEKLEQAILGAPELQEHLSAVRSEARDELAEERDFHERFIENRTRVYIGRQTLQDELKAFLTREEAKPCLVTGPSGSGKSAALAKFCSMLGSTGGSTDETIHATSPDGGQSIEKTVLPSLPKPDPETPSDNRHSPIVIRHFVGASPHSTGLREMLRHLCAELKDALKLEDEIKQDIRELSDQFREFLEKVEKLPARRRVVLVLDALNQLDETDNAHSLYWLPTQVSPQVRLIVSCIDDPDRADQPALAAMRSRQPHEIKVGPLNDVERLGIVREIPSIAAKTLDEKQVRLLLGNNATCNPLFLLVALEELRGFGSFEQLNQRIAGLPQTGDTLTAIFQQVIRRLGEDFNAATVKDVLTLLACARRGLSERELLDLIEGNNVRIEESAGDLFPILRQLRPFLQSRGPLLDFFHRHLAKAAHEEFFKADDSVRLATHQRLADYFVGGAKGSEAEKDWETDGVRGFAECVFHLSLGGQHDRAAELLGNFAFLLHKTRVGLLEGVFDDYDILCRKAPAEVGRQVEAWVAFFRQRAHALRRGYAAWPSYKILVQLAVEHATTSPITRAAEALVEAGRCNWVWLRSHWSANDIAVDPCLAVFEGHTGGVNGCYLLRDGRLLSWSKDRTLRLWAMNGEPGSVLVGHTASVLGSLVSKANQIISWSEDNTLRIWSIDGTEKSVLKGHSAEIKGCLELLDGRLLSWSSDGTLRFWSASGDGLGILGSHTGGVAGCVALSNNLLVSWGWDFALRFWNSDGTAGPVLRGHSEIIVGCLALPEEQLVSWSQDGRVCVWKADGTLLHAEKAHTGRVNGCLLIEIPDRGKFIGRPRISDAKASAPAILISWSANDNPRTWSTTDWSSQVFPGDAKAVGCLPLADGRVLSWRHQTLRILDFVSNTSVEIPTSQYLAMDDAIVLPGNKIAYWSCANGTIIVRGLDGRLLNILAGHSNWLSGCTDLGGSHMLSWGSDGTIRLWDYSIRRDNINSDEIGPADKSLLLKDGRCVVWSHGPLFSLTPKNGGPGVALRGHANWVTGCRQLADGRIVSSSQDQTLRIWNQDGSQGPVLEGHTAGIDGCLVLRDETIVSWSSDHTLRLWNPNGNVKRVLAEHTDMVHGCMLLSAEELLSWSWDGTLRIWRLADGAQVKVLRGHSQVVWGCIKLSNGRLVSRSADSTLRMWTPDGSLIRVLSDHRSGVEGCHERSDGGIVSWCHNLGDLSLRIWDKEGTLVSRLEGHQLWIRGCLPLLDGRVVSWSDDRTVRLWQSNGLGSIIFEGDVEAVWACEPLTIILVEKGFFLHKFEVDRGLMRTIAWIDATNPHAAPDGLDQNGLPYVRSLSTGLPPMVRLQAWRGPTFAVDMWDISALQVKG